MSWMRSSCSAAGWRRCGRPRLRGAGGRREQVRHEASRGLLEQSGGDVVVDGGDVARLGGAVPAEWHSELVDHLLVAPVRVRVRVRHPVPDAVDREQVRVRPPHGDLKHLVQLAQRRLTGDQHPPPHRRPDLPQLHLDLEDPRLAVTANGKHPPDAVTDAVPHPGLGSGRSVLARARPDEEYHRSGPCFWSGGGWALREPQSGGYPARLERTVQCERCCSRRTEVPRSSSGPTLRRHTPARGGSGSQYGRPARTRSTGRPSPAPWPAASPRSVSATWATTPPAWWTRSVRGSPVCWAAASTPRRSTPCWTPGRPSRRPSTGRWPPPS